jgi:predicted RNase H-like nuclease (RuvC/YqgF family)
MPERTSKKIGAWIPPDLYDKLHDLGYLGGRVSQTDTIIKGLELLITETERETSGGLVGDAGETLGDVSQVGELGALLEEKDKHIETLKQEVERISQMYDLHVKQTQTLINQLNDTRELLETTVSKNQLETNEPKKPFWKFW